LTAGCEFKAEGILRILVAGTNAKRSKIATPVKRAVYAIFLL
jgi:hypothetical protein